jgi:hypothetical protein
MSAKLQHPLMIIAFSNHGIIPTVWPDVQIIAVNGHLIGNGWLVLTIDQDNGKKEQDQQVEPFHFDLFSSLTG